MEIKYRGKVSNPHVGQLVWTGRGVGRITDYNDKLALWLVSYENGAKDAWYSADRLRNP